MSSKSSDSAGRTTGERRRAGRRRFEDREMRSATLTLLALACGFLGCHTEDASSPEHPRPNVILLLTDDQRWDAVGYAGNPIIRTSNMDALAREGLFFRNAYVTSSVCAASRASILSGQYARRHGIHGFDTGFSHDALQRTYPMLLRQAGYRVGFVGKYGVGTDLPENAFDYWRGFGGQGRYEQTNGAGRYRHLTRILGEQAVEFLETNPKGQPFCLSVSFKAPHPQDGDPRQFIYDVAYEDLYSGDHIPEAATGADRYFYTFPAFFTEDNEGRRRWEARFSNREKYQASVKGYYRLITGVDAVIGEIRDALERLNLADDTVIILTADNGFYLGEHGLAGKWYGHEESIRVPFIVYDPRLPRAGRGQVRDEMVLNIDLAPTILRLASEEIPARMQGIDVLGLIDGSEADWRQEFFYEHLFDHPNIPKSEGVVSRTYKYLRYVEQRPVFEELYDLVRDPHEENNLAGDDAHRERLTAMRERLVALRKAAR